MTLLTRYGLIGALLVAICLGGINGVLTYRLDKANEANQVLSNANGELSKAVEGVTRQSPHYRIQQVLFAALLRNNYG